MASSGSKASSKNQFGMEQALERHQKFIKSVRPYDGTLSSIAITNTLIYQKPTFLNLLRVSSGTEEKKPIITTPSGESASELFNNATDEQKKTLKALIEDLVAQRQNKYTEELTVYKEQLERMNASVSKKGWHAAGAANSIITIKENIADTLNKQHTLESTALENALKENANLVALTDVFKLQPNEISNFSNTLVQALKEEQQQNLKKLEQSVAQDKDALQKHIEQEGARINGLSALYLNQKGIKKEIDKRYEEKLNQEPGLMLSSDDSIMNDVIIESSSLFENIKPEDLIDKIKLSGGARLNVEDGVFKITHPREAFSPLYYLTTFNKNIDTVVGTLHAMGSKSIRIGVKHSDPEIANKLARREFMRAAQYFNPSEKPDPKNPDKMQSAIKVRVNGADVSISELFKGHSSDLQKANFAYNRNNASYKDELEMGVLAKTSQIQLEQEGIGLPAPSR